MKKVYLALIVVLLISGLVGYAQTTVDLDWNLYSGGFNIGFQAGDDAYAGLSTGGSHAYGTFEGTDSDNNPYGYGVDSVNTKVNANFEGGGQIIFGMDRQDSKTSMYGPAGQGTQSFVGSTGTGSFATNTSTNFAGMKSCNYGFQANNQWTASGDFQVNYSIYAGVASGAGFNAEGIGSVEATLMSSEANGGSSWRFGEGCGCYTNANASGEGSGSFNIYAQAPNQIDAFGSTVGGGTVNFNINYLNGFESDDINMSGS